MKSAHYSNSLARRSYYRVILLAFLTLLQSVSAQQPAGTLDPSLNIAVNSNPYAMLLQPDGKLLLGGAFLLSGPIRNLVRFNADGSSDTNFNSWSGTSGEVRSILLQPDGGVVLAGLFTSYNGVPHTNMARVLPSGGLDNSFNAGKGPNNRVYSMALQSDGKILLGGDFTQVNGTNAQY